MHKCLTCFGHLIFEISDFDLVFNSMPNQSFSKNKIKKRHSRENGNPENPKKHWIPAFARMTIKIFKKLPELIDKTYNIST